MTTPSAPNSHSANTPATPVAAPTKPRPIIEAERRYDSEKRDIALWPEPRKNVTEEQYAAMSESDIARLNSMRDLHGVVTVKKNGGPETKVFVSGWLSTEPNQPTRIKIMYDLNAGKGMMGSVRAMTRLRGGPADGSRGLILIGDLELNMPGGKERFTITGQVNGQYPDRELMVDAARVLGFTDTMIQQFTRRVDLEAAERARRFVGTANHQEPAARPAATMAA